MLWILQVADPDFKGVDKNYGFVIRAASEFQARHIAQNAIADEAYNAVDFWINPDHSTCVPLDNGGAVGIILTDFHAG